jgi:perosamine synthetase
MEIPFTRPYFLGHEGDAVAEAIASGWVSQGPRVRAFEAAFAERVGAREAVATTNCTTALQLALYVLGVGPGTEVIVPSLSFIATANSVWQNGATPVFADVDPRTYNLDPAAVERVITSRTKAIMPVHQLGLPADMDPLFEIAERHGLQIVEDAACAVGASYKSRPIGSLGPLACFSLHPRKVITTGEGGMITTADGDVAALSRSLRDHGASRSDHHRHHDAGSFLLSEYNHLGFNFRMTDIQGALGCAQMERADWILDRRRELASGYDEQLAGLDWLAPPHVPDGYVHGYQAYVCLFGADEATLGNATALNGRRNELMRLLEERGIATRQGTHSPVLTGYYAGKYDLRPEQFPKSVVADRLSLALPLFPQMTEDDQTFVTAELERAFASV